jgi:hypothetical protein
LVDRKQSEPTGEGHHPPAKVDDRSSMAQAMDKVSQITAVSLTLVVPTLLGYGLDLWLETGIALTVVGFLLGAMAGTWQLYKLVQYMD